MSACLFVSLSSHFPPPCHPRLHSAIIPIVNCRLQIANCILLHLIGNIQYITCNLETLVSEIAELADAESFDELESRPPNIPEELAILPLFNVVIYPQTVVPLAVGQEQSIKLIDEAVLGERMIGLVTLKNEQERPDPIAPADFYEIGTAALVHRLLRLPDNTLRVAVQGVARIQIEEIIQTEPYFRARVRVIEESAGDDIETQALMRNVISLAEQILQLLPNQSEELQSQIVNEDDPSRLVYLVAVSQ